MAYYLAYERVPDSYEGINIKRTTRGKNLFLNSSCDCTLEGIDRFTMQYITSEQLTHELHCDKFIPWPYGSVAIVCINDIGEITRIEKDLLFKESKKYLDNPILVLEYLINQFSACNIEFVIELYTKSEDKRTKEKLVKLIEKMKAKLSYDTPLEMAEIVHIADLLVYSTENTEHMQEPRLYEYSKVHNVVVAIANYENKLKENKQSYKRTKTKNT